LFVVCFVLFLSGQFRCPNEYFSVCFFSIGLPHPACTSQLSILMNVVSPHVIATNVEKMCTKRGYTGFLTSDDAAFDYQCFDEVKGVRVYVSLVDVVNVALIDAFVEKLETTTPIRIIAIHSGRLQPFAVNKIKCTSLADGRSLASAIETFSALFMSFCLVEHAMVDHHTLLSPEEADAMRQKYQVERFACINNDDPVVRFYRWQRGDVVRIQRRNQFFNDQYYREVA
jgi:DNA-directed RNA polymerase subunit H (RpoH/RPB5)